MRYEIRELDVGGILDQAIKLTKDNFWLFTKIVLVLMVPFSLIGGLLIQWNMPDVPAVVQPGMYAPGSHFGMPFPLLAIIAATSLISVLIIYPITDAAMIYAIANSYLEKPIGMADAFGRAFRILLPLIGTWILMSLAIGGPMIVGFIVALIVGPVGFLLMPFLAIASLVFAFWFMLSSRIVVIEGISGTAALARSKQLMKGNVGTAFVLGIVVFVIAALVGSVPRLIAQPELRVLATTILQAILSIFAAAAWVVFYFSCRCKAENFDLTVLADSVAAEDVPALE